MRIVIAGSSGHIGTALVSDLRQAGHDVLRLVRRAPSAPDERRWDPPAGRIDDGTFDGVDAVVNLCGVSVGGRRWSGAYKQQLRDSRIVPTEVLARGVADHGVPVLLNASGIDAYGHTGDAVIDESAPLGDTFLAVLCRDWEGATAPAAAGGARVVLLRSALVLSSNAGIVAKLRPVFNLMIGAPLGDGSQWFPWISHDDELGAIRFALEHDDVSGPVNLVGPEQITNEQFTRAFAASLGKRSLPIKVPAFALKAGLGEFSGNLLTGVRAEPGVLREHGYVFAHTTARSALDAAAGR